MWHKRDISQNERIKENLYSSWKQETDEALKAYKLSIIPKKN
jgi:hypothetical protein